MLPLKRACVPVAPPSTHAPPLIIALTIDSQKHSQTHFDRILHKQGDVLCPLPAPYLHKPLGGSEVVQRHVGGHAP